MYIIGDAKEDLAYNSQEILRAATLLDQYGRGIKKPELKGVLTNVAKMLAAWRIHDVRAFMSIDGDIFTPLECQEILQQRDGQGTWLRPTAGLVAKTLREEQKNLLVVARGKGSSANIERAKKFCMALHWRALTHHDRAFRPRGLAA